MGKNWNFKIWDRDIWMEDVEMLQLLSLSLFLWSVHLQGKHMFLSVLLCHGINFSGAGPCWGNLPVSSSTCAEYALFWVHHLQAFLTKILNYISPNSLISLKKKKSFDLYITNFYLYVPICSEFQWRRTVTIHRVLPRTPIWSSGLVKLNTFSL